MDVPSHEERFHANVVGLAELLYEIVSDIHLRGYNIINPSVIQLVRCLLAKMNRLDLINGFITYSHLHWDNIRNHNRDFFIYNASEVFGDLPMKEVDAFRKLFSLRDKDGNYIISKEDEEDMWAFFESLVKIAIKYVHSQRDPLLVRGERDKNCIENRIYQTRFMSEITDLQHHATTWKIILEFPSN